MRILLFLLLLSFEISAGVSLRETLQSLLPQPISELKVHKTSLREVEQALGKPDLKEAQNLYWERDGLKYALKLTFNKKNVLTSIHYTFTRNKPSVEKNLEIDSDKLTPYPAQGKSAGRFLLLKEKDTEVTIDPISKTIHTVKIL